MKEKKTIFRFILSGLLCLLLLGGCGQRLPESLPAPTESESLTPAVTETLGVTDPSGTAAESRAAETLPTETLPTETTAALATAAPTAAETTPESTPVPTTPFVSETRADGAYSAQINGTVFWIKDNRAIEPECRLNIDSMHLSDFGTSFAESFPVVRESYRLCPGEAMETEVVHIHSEKPGPVVYVVAGTHGDERAGWFAGLMLREATVSCGDLYVLSIANTQGARALKRYVTGKEDLNRAYPGSSSGQANRLAAAVFSDIREKSPEIVLDLHEAIVVQSGRDFLGSTLIFSDLSITEEFGDLFFDLRDATCEGEICFEPFGYQGPGPKGSLNYTVTTELKIPTLTIETFRGYPMEHRVEEHLEIAEYVLAWKGMR